METYGCADEVRAEGEIFKISKKSPQIRKNMFLLQFI